MTQQTLSESEESAFRESLGEGSTEVALIVADEAESLSPRQRAVDDTQRMEIDVAITTAKKFPRQIAAFLDDIRSLATIDEEVAESCFYSLPRAGKNIQGPSIRLAEMAAYSWGNLRTGARPGGLSDDGVSVTGYGFCHDLEKNVYVATEAKRPVLDRNGKLFNEDMLLVTANAAAAVAQRNAIFKVIPRALIRKAYMDCLEIATGGAKTLSDRRGRIFEKLKKVNSAITDEGILAALGRPSIEEVTADDVIHLMGLGTAIKDGSTSIEEAFPKPPESRSASSALKSNGNK